MRKYFFLFLLFGIQVTYTQNRSNIIVVPKGSPLINGSAINQNAWKSANQIKTEIGNEIYLVHDGQYLYFGFRGIYEPWSHLYLNNRSNVQVLHITTAMGRVVYNLNHYGTWQPDRQFNWKVKNIQHDYNISSTTDGKNYIEDEGWTTAINSYKDKKEVVFKIAIKNIDVNNLYLAWVFGFKGTSYLFWPQSLDDDTLKPEVFTGYNPSDLKFDFKSWALLKLAD